LVHGQINLSLFDLQNSYHRHFTICSYSYPTNEATKINGQVLDL
jgi:hypothetical protein